MTERSRIDKPSVPNLFIIGMPRSGTKLFRSLLCNHSKVYIPDIELVFLPRIIRKYGDGVLTEHCVAELIEEVKRSVFFFYYLKDNRFDFSVLYKVDNIRDFVEAIFSQLAGNDKSYEYVGDKSPGNIDHVELLMDFYPSARFIHIVRDPRDYALSVKNAWNKSMRRAVSRWSSSVGSFNSLTQKMGGRVLEIRYEDLLDNPEETMRKCTTFLDLDFEPQVLRLNNIVENLGDAKSFSIEKGNKDKYTLHMNPKLVTWIENHTVSLLDRYGYSHQSSRNESKKMSSWSLKVLALSDQISLIIFNIKEHGLRNGFRKMISIFYSKS